MGKVSNVSGFMVDFMLSKSLSVLKDYLQAGPMVILFKCELYIFRICSLKYLEACGWGDYYLLLDAARILFQLVLEYGQSSRGMTEF